MIINFFDVTVGTVKINRVLLGNSLIWMRDTGLAKDYAGTGWYKATDTGTVYCKDVPSLHTHTFSGDPKEYISVYTIDDLRRYGDRVATSNMTSFANLFSGRVLPTNADLSNWDTSNVTNMNSMFYASLEFNQNISGWDVSKVTNMGRMFTQARKFNQNISGWNVSNVTDMGRMFNNADVFNQNISGWDVSKVVEMFGMFQLASAFNQNLSKWCVTKISTPPMYFSVNSPLTVDNTPVWGTCPRGEDTL